jgi:hypothetical protein
MSNFADTVLTRRVRHAAQCFALYCYTAGKSFIYGDFLLVGEVGLEPTKA